jgi:hypothetical protein
MSLSFAITSPRGFPVNLASKISELLRSIGVIIEIYPRFIPAEWVGGFLPIKVIAMPRSLIGVPFSSDIISGVELYFDDGVASLCSPASRSVADHTLFCLVAEAIARVTNGRLEMEGCECMLSPDQPFFDTIEAAESFALEATENDLRQVPFICWEAVE